MAEIVLGLATSHGPMLSTPPEQWGQRVAADRQNPRHHYKGRTYTFQELTGLRADERLQRQITPEVWRTRHSACQAAIGTLAEVFAATKPDVAVIVGNDQMEMFTDAVIPAFAVYWGETIENRWPSAAEMAKWEPGIEIAQRGRIPPGGATYAGVPSLGRHIIERAVADGFDVAAMKRLREGRVTVPHAYGFIYRQIMRDQAVPSVPIALNTFYPPNQPPQIGRAHV